MRYRSMRLLSIAALLSLLVTSCELLPPLPESQPAEAPAIPTLVAPTPLTDPGVVPRVPAFKRVFVVILENHEASSVTRDSMPYLSGLADKYALAERYYGVTHPSLPNYLALISGETFGIRATCHDCIQTVENLADQVEKSGRTWRAYFDDLPAPCFPGATHLQYALKHNPFMYFTSIREDPARCRNTVPLSALSSDLAAKRLPNLVWITPNLCHSGHDCDLAVADKWLESVLSPILASAAFRDESALFVTWDEGQTFEGCCGSPGGGRVFTVVASPLGKSGGYRSQTAYSHYSLLRTIEAAWNLSYLGNARSASAMTDFFASP